MSNPWWPPADQLHVEIFFGIITRQAVRRGSFVSVDDLEDAIRAFIDAYNDRAQPFTWTKSADELITKISRNRPPALVAVTGQPHPLALRAGH